MNLFKKKNIEQDLHYDLWSTAGEAVRDGQIQAWESHPRPQMKRDNFYILKGGWTLDDAPIAVPFPPQSMLSGYTQEVGTHLTYKKSFVLSEEYQKRIAGGERLLLHFGAVDQIAEVYVNDVFAGRHEGGYLPFSFDITAYLCIDASNGETKSDKRKCPEANKAEAACDACTQCIVVKVVDELDKDYPYGKQTLKRGGMWYTPVSGIWQTVWLEAVPPVYAKKIVIKPDLQGIDLMVDCACDSFTAVVDLENGRTYTKTVAGNKGRIHLDGEYADDGSLMKAVCWCPEKPHLYSMKVTAYAGHHVDEIETYFALRTISIEKKNDIPRVCLNGKPIFLHGILDQGYFSDGLYLPACEEEYEQDILRMKALGYNMLRKHIKIEPEYFYYACDKLGMLVMQDMVNNGPYSFFFDTALPTIGFKKRKDTGLGLDGKRQRMFISHTKDTIEHLYSHPSIIAYTIFNEGWGQFKSDYMYELVKELDDSRLIDSTSGWFAQNKNDFDSEHIYFKVIHLEVKKRPLFLSECGGYSLQVDGHYYNKKKQYGYGACKNKEELTEKIVYMYREMVLSSAAKGMCGCVYTQLSDVEDEINGLYTYDRKVCKVHPKELLVLAKELQDAVQ